MSKLIKTKRPKIVVDNNVGDGLVYTINAHPDTVFVNPSTYESLLKLYKDEEKRNLIKELLNK